MALSPCGVEMDASARETVHYSSTENFPIACYRDDMQTFFVPWHWHEEFECILGWEGTVAVGVRGERILLHPGEGLFINSGVLHNVEIAEGHPSVLRSIVFHPRLIGGTVDSVFWQRLVSPLLQDQAVPYFKLTEAVPWQRKIMETVLICWQETVDETEDHENYVRYQLSRAFRQLNAHLPECSARRTRQDQSTAQRMKLLLQFIESHYTEDLTLAQIAAAANLSNNACLRCFRQALNVSPIQYIRQLRVEKAAQLLLSTRRKVGDIALECGFTDVSYFTRTFREQKGVSPREFRQRARR